MRPPACVCFVRDTRFGGCIKNAEISTGSRASSRGRLRGFGVAGRLVGVLAIMPFSTKGVACLLPKTFSNFWIRAESKSRHCCWVPLFKTQTRSLPRPLFLGTRRNRSQPELTNPQLFWKPLPETTGFICLFGSRKPMASLPCSCQMGNMLPRCPSQAKQDGPTRVLLRAAWRAATTHEDCRLRPVTPNGWSVEARYGRWRLYWSIRMSEKIVMCSSLMSAICMPEVCEKCKNARVRLKCCASAK